jgi:MoaA/NifB/PqqE/SkfB family radical SAM enzyme
MKRDLSQQVTAFIISAGDNPNFPACIEAINNQTVDVTIDIIRDYHPLSLAFQEMLVRCKTPYYIEVDEDMVLEPGAIEKMYEAIMSAGEKDAMIAFRLLDVHIDFAIYGVKIYKYEIFKNYPYNLQHMSCEVEQLDRMKADGYSYKTLEDIVGKHSPLWNNELIFERYLNLMEKFKEFKYVWLEGLPRKLFEIFQKDPSEINLFAILGAYTSIASDRKLQLGEKDFTAKRLAYCRMQGYLERPTTGTLFVTNKCNLKCQFCQRQHREMEDFPDMMIEVVDDLLFRFPTINALCICGFGEPFLCDNLVAIMQYLKKPSEQWRSFGKSIFIGIITNGTLLTERLPWISDCLPEYISVSLNASNALEYQRITGAALFDTVLDGIRLSVSMGLTTYLSRVCDKTNIGQIQEFLQLAKSLGVTGVHLHNILPHFDDDENTKFWDIALTKEDQGLIDSIKALPESDIILRYPVLISKDEVRKNCLFPWKTIGINGNRSITICNSVIPPNKEHGSISEDIVWQNEYCQKFRETKVGEQLDVCKKCFRNWKYD